MSNEDHYECGSIGPFWVTISHEWDDTLTITADASFRYAFPPLKLPVDTNLDSARQQAIAACQEVMERWQSEMAAVKPEVPLEF